MESNSSSSFIDLKVISGKDVRAFNFFQKLQLYVQVYITSGDSTKKGDKKQRTPADKEGDANPEWNHSMRFDYDRNKVDDLFLQFDLRHEGNMFGDKTIGQVRVPLTDLIEDSSSVRFVSYEVRSPPPDAKPNGVLNFSYKLCGVDVVPQPQISGYSIVEEHPPPPSPPSPPPPLPPPHIEIESGLSSPKIHYPTIDLDLGLNHHQAPPPYPPLQNQENDYYYSPSESFNHHPIPPPPLPAPWPHGGHYPPPPPPQGFHPWGPHPHPHPDPYGGYYGQPHGPPAGWSNYWQQHGSFSSSPSWNGR